VDRRGFERAFNADAVVSLDDCGVGVDDDDDSGLCLMSETSVSMKLGAVVSLGCASALPEAALVAGLDLVDVEGSGDEFTWGLE
jgi:hypothetical protein